MSKTRQEIFDIAYRGLASQGFAQSIAYDANGRDKCRYRDGKGRKCAIGWCIPDDMYDERFDEPKTRFEDVLQAAGIEFSERVFCSDLQNVHDLHEVPHMMMAALGRFASLHDLTIPEVSP